jgi:hypothetical protein
VRQWVPRSAFASAAIALAVAGCGSSSSPSAGPTIRRAADVTAQAPGYKVSGDVKVTVNAPQHVVVPVSITGSFDRRDKVGAVTAVAHVAGREVRIRELISRLTLYMPAAAVPNARTLLGTKRWIKINISGAIPGGGLSSLSTATDPSQFVDYLRAVSSNTTNLGTATIGGVRTTHYHAIVDLSRYPNLVPPAQRHAVRASVKTLEAALGRRSIPFDVWIDSHHLVRRESFAFTECVSGVHNTLNMTMNLYDYGPQPKPSIPAARDVYDLTPQVSAALHHAKLGCT